MVDATSLPQPASQPLSATRIPIPMTTVPSCIDAVQRMKGPSSGSAAQTAAAKTGCSFAARTLFSLSVAGFVCVGWIV